MTAVSFGAIPVLVRALLGDAAGAQVLAVVIGCAALAAGLWRWRDRLQLSMIPLPRLRHRGIAELSASKP